MVLSSCIPRRVQPQGDSLGGRCPAARGEKMQYRVTEAGEGRAGK
jgi:hypothetical protein